jgi:hypothetical protein
MLSACAVGKQLTPIIVDISHILSDTKIPLKEISNSQTSANTIYVT